MAEHGYDVGYAMHALRLGVPGLELLTTGRVGGRPAAPLAPGVLGDAGSARTVVGPTGAGHGPGPRELLGDVDELAVGLLRHPGRHLEGLVGRELVPLHEDALGLADQVAVVHSAAQVVLAPGPARATAACAARTRPTSSDSSPKVPGARA